jgi:hypothetical protein
MEVTALDIAYSKIKTNRSVRNHTFLHINIPPSRRDFTDGVSGFVVGR